MPDIKLAIKYVWIEKFIRGQTRGNIFWCSCPGSIIDTIGDNDYKVMAKEFGYEYTDKCAK